MFPLSKMYQQCSVGSHPRLRPKKELFAFFARRMMGLPQGGGGFLATRFVHKKVFPTKAPAICPLGWSAYSAPFLGPRVFFHMLLTHFGASVQRQASVSAQRRCLGWRVRQSPGGDAIAGTSSYDVVQVKLQSPRIFPTPEELL